MRRDQSRERESRPSLKFVALALWLLGVCASAAVKARANASASSARAEAFKRRGRRVCVEV